MTGIRVAGFLLSLFAAALFFVPSGSRAATCGTDDKVTIAEMTWLSASSLAHITQRILARGYGCDAEVVPGDTVPTATSMLTKGEPDIAPELWVSTAQSIWDEMQEKGNVYKASDIFSEGGKEGWWVPDYVAEANPGLRSVEDLEDYAHLFTEPGTGDKGRFYGCPPGWGCEIITNNLFAALELGDEYELFSPGSGANLKASIARKVTREQPIVGYYWGPTAVIGKYDLVRLDMPAYDPEVFKCLTDKNCAEPQVSGWKPGEVAVAVTSSLREDAPDVAAFLSKLQVPNDVINAVLAWGDTNSASPEDTAAYFFRNYEDVWTAWVPAEVAERVRASLSG